MSLRQLLRNRRSRGVLLGVVCAGICWLLGFSGWVRGLENWALDTCFLFRGRRPSSAKVVIVALDEPSMQALDKPLVYLSPELAKVVTYLHQQGAAAVGVDILLPQSVETIEGLDYGGPGDAETMGIAAGRAGNVVLPLLLVAGEEPLRPIGQWEPFVEPAWTALGLVNVDADADTYVRRQQLRAADRRGKAYPCFALALLGLQERLSAEWFSASPLRLDDRTIPLDADGLMPINYVGPPGSIDSVPFRDVLASAEGREPIDRDWKDAAVLIGLPASTQQDRHATPYLGQSVAGMLRSSWLGCKPELMSGVEVHANILATLADRAFLTTPWWLSTPLLLAVAGAVLGAILVRVSLEVGAIVTVAHHFAWQAFCVLAFCWGNWRVGILPMLMLGVLLYGSAFSLRWRWMRRMFGTFKSEAIARALENDPGRSDQRDITVLFSDIRNFTPFAETHSPGEVVALLNEFFTAVVPAIEAQGGTVNLYIGDAVMVIFGAPKPQPDHALRAVRAAVEMVRRVHRLEDRWKQLGAEVFRIGVGIHTGKAVVGTVGSPRRLDYTAIGDTVNTASRIEAGNKELGSEILISRATCEAIPAGQRAGLSSTWEPLSLSVKGKQQVVEVYAVAASADSA